MVMFNMATNLFKYDQKRTIIQAKCWKSSGKLMVLGVPIMSHFRVATEHRCKISSSLGLGDDSFINSKSYLVSPYLLARL